MIRDKLNLINKYHFIPVICLPVDQIPRHTSFFFNITMITFDQATQLFLTMTTISHNAGITFLQPSVNRTQQECDSDKWQWGIQELKNDSYKILER